MRIKENRNDLTNTEILLGDYIIAHKDKVIEYSSQKLASLTNTSPASVIRFAKKIGYDGFTDLKLDLVLDVQSDVRSFNNILDTNDDIKTLIYKTKQSDLQTIDATYDLLDVKVVEKVVEKIIDARKIYLFGIGGSGLVCQDFQYKLLRIGKDVDYYLDTHLQLTAVPNIKKGDLALFVSYSGNTKELLVAAKWLQQQSVDVISITNSKYNNLAKLSDYVITIPSEEQTLRIGAMSSRLSSLIVIDILYYGIAKNDVENTNEKIISTRKIIDEIEK
ncbi:MAG: MurR/RpiR family transcriptional regulator [Erysipelotrichaceae bacterium]|nr:MurR/RpiR family transcriptional regulator [Erysipelotrichaceae bacterium]